MLHRISTVLAALAVLCLTPACDAPEAEPSEECLAIDGSDDTVVVRPELRLAAPAGAPAPLELTFREQGPPQAKYIQKIGDPPQAIDAKLFAHAVTVCADKQPKANWLLTLSWYQPDTKDPKRVLGLGGSTMAEFPLFDCLSQFFDANGAVPLP
jgi:hypothetical protein